MLFVSGGRGDDTEPEQLTDTTQLSTLTAIGSSYILERGEMGMLWAVSRPL
jgi:hypothetical protein